MLRERTTSALLFVPPLLVLLLLGEPWIALLVCLGVLWASVETARLLRAASYPVEVALVVAGGLVVAADAAAPPELRPTSLLLTAIVVTVTAAGALVQLDPRRGLASWMATAFGALYVGLLGFVVRAGSVGPAIAPGSAIGGLGWLSADRAWILVLVLTVWSFDTGAYFVGRQFGRRKLAPHLSPGKSYWGLAGGTAVAVIVAGACFLALGQSPLAGAVYGVLVSAADTAGDLAESMLKRAADAKDSGTLIPGHGGLLDRLDSFLFAAPVATLFVAAVFR